MSTIFSIDVGKKYEEYVDDNIMIHFIEKPEKITMAK